MKEMVSINYKVIEPLINQILFGKPNKPNFENGKADLSKDFLETRSNYENDDWLIENFIGKQTEIILNNFTNKDKLSVFQMILADPSYIDAMIMEIKIRNSDISNANIQIIRETIVDKIGDYILKGEVNYYIKRFFALFFEELIYSKFVFNSSITEDEYLQIYLENTNGKTLV